MKPFDDPNLRPIDPPPFDHLVVWYIHETDIPKDCSEPISAEAKLEDTALNPVSCESNTVSTASKSERINFGSNCYQ